MTNFIEELDHGDCFQYSNTIYVLTSDSRSNGNKLCIDLKTGNSRWLQSDTIINKIQIFFTDKDSNIIAIKETKKDDVDQN